MRIRSCAPGFAVKGWQTATTLRRRATPKVTHKMNTVPVLHRPCLQALYPWTLVEKSTTTAKKPITELRYLVERSAVSITGRTGRAVAPDGVTVTTWTTGPKTKTRTC